MSDSYSAQRLVAGALALLFLVVVSVGATAILYTPPKSVGVDAPQDVFSAGRAMALIEEFAKAPHPLGTLENLRVQGVLVDALEELGYEVIVQDQPIFRGHSVARARNVFARLEGTQSTGVIAMCAHYDSVPYGPGAADDGSGVAAIIETARVLRNSAPLRNDIIFLLTDGEENGLLGPRTFLEHNPWRDDLKLVINFEARGHFGPAMMYLTWPGNEFTIRNFIEGASHPVASSVMFDFADALPTSSDYYVFKAEGYPGFDLAYVRGLAYYHTPNDSPEKLSLRSLQHHGSYGVSLTQHFGNLDLNLLLADPDQRVVYFNTLGHHMVWYRTAWIWPVTLLAFAIAIVAFALGAARQRISLGGVVAGMAVFLAPLLVAPVLAAIPVYFALHQFGPYALYNQGWFIAGYCLLALAAYGAVYAIAARMIRPESLAMAPVLLLLPVLILGTILLPMGSFVFAWPIMGTALGLLALFLLPGSDGPWLRLIAGTAGAIPALVLMSPYVLMLLETFTFFMGPLVLLLAGVIIGLSVLPLALAGQAPRIGLVVPVVALLLAVLTFAVAILDTRHTPDRPKMNYLMYAADFDEQRAIYATTDRDLDEWTSQFFGEGDTRGPIHDFIPFEREEFRLAEAPMADMETGSIEAIEDVMDGEVRRVTLFVQAAPETAEFYLWTDAEAHVRSVTMNGQPWTTGERLPVAQWYGHIRGRYDEGVTLVFELDAAPLLPLNLTMVEQSYGLPNVPFMRLRPAWMIPMSNTMPVSWEFSRERLLSGDPMSALRFSPGSRSTHIYARQSFSFAPPPVEAPDSGDVQTGVVPPGSV